MKSINLKSLVEIFRYNLKKDSSIKFIQLYNSKIKISDLIALEKLVLEVLNIDKAIPIYFLNNFYIDYTIPQIGKEFDLLRFTSNSILNIELKLEKTTKIEKQLLQNKYYLKFLDKKLYLFTYIAKENKIYKLNNENRLIETSLKELITIIKKQYDENIILDNLDEYFKPSNYLISPFNKIKEFINGEYFLTKEQEQIEQELHEKLKTGNKHFLITGEAGSGKTLLAYHLAKSFQNEGLNVVIIQTGSLNSGHIKLKEDFSWNILPIKDWDKILSVKSLDVIFIDEVQRANNKYQFSKIMEYIINNDVLLIMSGDKMQTLGANEGWAIEQENIIQFNLTNKIRTNKELSNFIKVLLDLKRKHHINISSKNIDITYFDTISEAKQYIQSKSETYSYISYTPNLGRHTPYCKAHSLNFSTIGTSHQVIGQEFENVIAIMDEHFYYNEENKLKAFKIKDNPYSTLKMFFQQITRAINKLEIVIISNIDLYNKIINIFNKN